MKRLLVYLFIVLGLGLAVSVNAFAGSKWGKGEIKLSDSVIRAFIDYVKGSTVSKAPYLFAVSKNGFGYQYYYCPHGLNNCSGGGEQILEECEKNSHGVECSLFARGRLIKWKNGINPGKGKASKIISKWSDTEIRAKLTELGFLGGDTKKIEKKEPSQTQEVTEKEVVWEVYAKAVVGDAMHSGFKVTESYILNKKKSKNAKQNFNKTVKKVLKKCKKFSTQMNSMMQPCIVTVIKYYEPNDPSKNRKLVNTSGINIEDVRVSWSGFESGTFFVENQKVADISKSVGSTSAGVKNLPIICKASKDRYNSSKPYILNYDQLKEFKDELINNPKLILKENWINHEQQIKSKKLKCPEGSKKIKPYVKKGNKISNTYVSTLNSQIFNTLKETDLARLYLYAFAKYSNLNTLFTSTTRLPFEAKLIDNYDENEIAKAEAEEKKLAKQKEEKKLAKRKERENKAS